MAQIIGVFRIGRDAELRYAPNGDAVIGLALAFNFYDKNAEKNKGSQWIEAAIFGKRAESLAPYLLKGSQIYAVINDPHIETYPKKDGTTGTKLVGKVSEVELLGGKSDSAASPAPKQEAPKPTPRPAAKAQTFDDDFDIPF